MKSWIKYGIVVVVIAILFYTAYLVYKSKQKPEEQLPVVVEEATPVEKKKLRIGIAGFDTINPLVSKNKEVLQMANLIYEPLVRVTEDYRTELCLAKEISRADAMTYLVKLENNVKWQDNTPFEAQDVQFTIDRLKEGKSIYSYNAEGIASVEVIDKTTLKIHLNNPVSHFEYNLAFPILSHAQYAEEDFWSSSKTPIGTGEFRIASLETSGMELKRNENYRKKENSNLDQINVSFFGSMGEVYNSFKMGNIDFFGTRNREIEEYIGTMGYVKKEYKGREFDFLAINHENLALNCLEVRQAIQYAIDKNNMLSSVLNNKGYVADFPLDYGCYLYKDGSMGADYNTEKAKQVLVENGWEYKNNRWQKQIDRRNVRLDFDLVLWKDNGERLKAAEIIQEQLQAIGIKVTLRKVNNDQYNSCLQRKSYDLMVSGVYNSYSPELDYFLGEGNIENYINTEVTTLLSEMQNITDAKLLQEKMNRVVEICKQEVPWIGLYRSQNQVIYSTSVMGNITPNNYNYFYGINSWVRR